MRLRRRRTPQARPGAPRLLVPFSGGQLDPAVLEAALRIARADGAVFVPAYLIMLYQGRFGRLNAFLGGPPVPASSSVVPPRKKKETGRTKVDA